MAKSNKVAIVTGSATGLGASCALDLAERGWNVAINYTKSKKEADETYEAVKAKGVEAILVQADMGQDADCRRLADETMKKWGRIDGLINNAGTTKFQNQGDLDGVTPSRSPWLWNLVVPALLIRPSMRPHFFIVSAASLRQSASWPMSACTRIASTPFDFTVA